MNRVLEWPEPPKKDFRKSFLMYRRPRPPPPVNTDKEVDCTPYEHIHYRPYCQTIRLEKRRKALKRPKFPRMPIIMENLSMFEWLHRVGAHKSLTNEELLFLLTNGLFHQNGGNAAIVFNKDNRTGKSATSRMNAAFGKAEKKEDAMKELMEAHNAPKVKFSIPENFKRYGIGTFLKRMNDDEPPMDESYPGTSDSYCDYHKKKAVEVVTLE